VRADRLRRSWGDHDRRRPGSALGIVAVGIAVLALLVPSASGAFNAEIHNTADTFGSGVLGVQESTSCQAVDTTAPETTCQPLLSGQALGESETTFQTGLSNPAGATLPGTVSLAGDGTPAVEVTPDVSGNAHDGVLVGDATVAGSGGPFSGSGYLSLGGDGWVRTMGSSTTWATAATHAYSFVGFVELPTTSDAGTILAATSSPGITGPVFNLAPIVALQGDQLEEYTWIYHQHTLVDSTDLSPNEWYFFAATFEAPSATIYCDNCTGCSTTDGSGDTATDSCPTCGTASGDPPCTWSVTLYQAGSDTPLSDAQAFLATNQAIDPAWWHIGATRTQGTGIPSISQECFSGNLAGLAVLPSALTTADAGTLAAEPSAVAYTSAVEADSPFAFWPLTTTAGSTDPALDQASLYPNLASTTDDAVGLGGSLSSQTGPYGGEAVALNENASAPEGVGASWIDTNLTSTSAAPSGGVTVAAWVDLAGQGGPVAVFGAASGPDVPITTDDNDFGPAIWASPGSTTGTWSLSAGDYTSGCPGGDEQGPNCTLVEAGSEAEAGWQLVVASFSSTSTSTDVTLWVGPEGATPSPATADASTGALSYSGSWDLGWGPEQDLASSPFSTPYFDGAMADVAIVPASLSSTQVDALYGATSASAYEADLASDGASAIWALQPPSAPSPLSSFVGLTVGLTTPAGSTTCLLPAATTACQSLDAASTSFASLGQAATFTLPGTPAGETPSSDTLDLGLGLTSATPLAWSDEWIVGGGLSIVDQASSWQATIVNPLSAGPIQLDP